MSATVVVGFAIDFQHDVTRSRLELVVKLLA